MATAQELQIAPLRGDGRLRKEVVVWVVRHGDDLYVRCWRGRDGAWFRAALVSHEGRVRVDGMERDVTFVEEADEQVNDRIDAAYRSKYRRYGSYVPPMVSQQARAATLKLVRRSGGIA